MGGRRWDARLKRVISVRQDREPRRQRGLEDSPRACMTVGWCRMSLSGDSATNSFAEMAGVLLWGLRLKGFYNGCVRDCA